MISFSYQELATILIKEQGIHKGIWGLYLKFGIAATNIEDADSKMLVPAAIIPVPEIGLQQFPKENNLTVDAAKINPANGGKKPKA